MNLPTLRPRLVPYALGALVIALTAPALGQTCPLSLTAPVAYPVGNGPAALAIGDFNADGRADIAVANSAANTLSILFGNGDGTFHASAAGPVALAGSPSAILATDFDSDGRCDLIVSFSDSGNVLALHSNGNGTFASSVLGTFLPPVGLALANRFDEPHLPCIAVSDQTGGGSFASFACDGAGGFSQSATTTIGTPIGAMAAVDINLLSDHNQDLAVGSASTNLVRLYFNSGVDFTTGPVLNIGGSSTAMAAGNVTGDIFPDLVVLKSTGFIQTLRGGTTNTLQSTSNIPASSLLGVAVGDINADGNGEVLIAGDTTRVFTNVGTGINGSFVTLAIPETSRAAAIGDVTGDGLPDLVVLSSAGPATAGTVWVILNTSLTISQQPVPQPVATAATAIFTVAAAGRDGFTYQWRKDGQPLTDGPHFAGCTTATLTVTGCTTIEAGLYDAVASAAACNAVVTSITSRAAPLTIHTPCSADFDGNGIIQPADIAVFVSTWFSALTNGC